MEITKFKVIFWDFDGVIKESVQVKTEAYLQLFEEYGGEVADKIRQHHEREGGISRYIKIPLYFREFVQREVSEKEIKIQCDQFSEIVVEQVVNAAWVPGVKKYLEENHQRQKFYIVTGTPHEEMLGILKKLGIESFFEASFGAPHKKTAVLEEILKSEGFRRDDCLMIGDASTDYQAAKQNQVPFLLRETDENRELFAKIDCPRVKNFLG